MTESAFGHRLHSSELSTRITLQCWHLTSWLPGSAISASSLCMKSFDERQSRGSLNSSKDFSETRLAIHFRDFGEMLLMSSGTELISGRWLAMKLVQREVRESISRKSAEIKIGTTFYAKSVGSFPLTCFISHSNMSMSHCTEMSMSSAESDIVKCFSKYFISFRSNSFGHWKFFFTFFFSSAT